MNIYFELSDCVVGPEGKYVAAYDHRKDDPLGFRYLNLIRNSERAWGEHDDGEVYFIKNRHSVPHNTLVDMKEFFWIKLKCQAV